ncbi:hypothetical protein OIU84_001729 [Salix udensis]|uniref:S phase cyclin A-associated protein in the endoplasmic reticulum N-terminal domain-containing protein n=1 Tax=Salix udensis TaxID=889485 RepID=A0AAD6K7U0_9ROSI|nr:hypothetical protein OIU84_001729 [Salix udensis]
MDNSGEAVDDQGSGWFQGFSFQSGCISAIDEFMSLRGIEAAQSFLCMARLKDFLARMEGQIIPGMAVASAASSSSVSNQDESSVFLPHKLLAMQHVEDSGCSKLLPVLITNSHAKVGDTQKLKDKPNVLPKINKDVSETSLQDLEVPSTDDRMVVPNYPQNCKEKTTENSKTIDGFSCSTHPSGGDSVREVKLNVPVGVSEMHELKISELTVMSTNSTIIPLDSELLLTRSTAPEISELPVGNGNSGMVSDSTGQDHLMWHCTMKVSLKSTELDPLEKVTRVKAKKRFRERLWCFLFENLNRAVDELYLLCELECDVGQMKEAILVLEEAASDFKELTKASTGV